MNYYSVIFKNQKLELAFDDNIIEVVKLKNNLLYYLEYNITCSDLNLYLIENDTDILLNNNENITPTNLYLLEIPNHTAISGFSNVLDG